MKKNYSISLTLICAFLLSSYSSTLTAQSKLHRFQKPIVKAFRKGSFLVSISEGVTTSVYSTSLEGIKSENQSSGDTKFMEGTRDPLIIEYGISDHWGFGLTSGKDLFTVNPSDFYNFTLSNNEPIKVATNEFTFDANYHIYVNKRLDLAVFNSIGAFSVTFQGQDADASPYKYTSNGNIIRLGTKVRYYFLRRLGAFGMASLYAANTSPKDVKDNTVANNYSTSVSGYAVEIGLCYRLFR